MVLEPSNGLAIGRSRRLRRGNIASSSTPLGGGRSATSSGLFTRQSSGLVRELGIPAATAISLASVAVVNTFINFNAGLTAFNQADMTLPLLLGAGIWLVAMVACLRPVPPRRPGS